MTRTHFIAGYERLIAFSRKDGYSLVFDDILDTVEDAARLVKSEGEMIIKVIRFNLITNVSEDVSEPIAEATIKLFGDGLDEDGDVDPFIEHSAAWDEHIAELAREAAEEARFGSYEQQHRLRLSDVF